MPLLVRPFEREEIAAKLDAVAELRIKVFAEFPYLYAGDLEYERNYLEVYLESAGAIIVGAWEGDRLVGASTGTPMEDHSDGFAFDDAFSGSGLAVNEIFYCAELVLLSEYRGRGIGGAFFDHRETHARALGRRWSAFCAVIRPDDHPARPEGYTPHDGFWTKRGYAKLSGAIARFNWKDHGDARETEKKLQFWICDLEGN